MDIDKLAKIRNLNTKQQNEIAKFNIAETANLFLDNEAVPEAIRCWLESKQFSKENCILVEYGHGPICCEHTYSGVLLSKNLEFWQFEVELDTKKISVSEVYTWKNITNEILVSEHTKGVGKSWGFLCIQVLREILRQG